MEQRDTPRPHIVEPNPEKSAEQLSERVRSLRLPQGVVAGKSGHRWRSVVGLLLMIGGGIFAYKTYLSHRGAQASADNAPPKTESNATASSSSSASALAVPPTGDIVLESKGYVIPAHQILVSPKVSGMIVKLHVLEGLRVSKGDVLAELEDIDYQADRDRAKASLNAAEKYLEELERGFRPDEISQARAELAESEVQRVQLEADYKRAAELFTRHVTSKEDYDAAVSRFQAMDRRVQRLGFALKLMEEGPRIERIEAARAQVRLSAAELAKCEWKLGNCVIRAPISGTILKKNAEEGNIVNPIAFNGSYSLCEMADLSDLEVDLTIQERDISKVFKGQKCKIRAEAYLDRVYEGVVSRLMPIADRAKGAIPVRVKLTVPAEEEGVYLKPEMGALVTFLKKTP
jgi:multidrug resistance efflux pump